MWMPRLDAASELVDSMFTRPMALDAPSFVFVFFPVTLIAFFLLRRRSTKAATGALVGASLVFYGLVDVACLPLLLGLTFVNHALTRVVAYHSSHRSRAIVLGVSINLVALALFKYGGYGRDSNVLPLGLSFYTLAQMSALFDLRRNGVQPLAFREHLLFTSFFAQIGAGPISRFRDVAPQLRSLGRDAVSHASIAAGFSLFVVGLAKKLILADNLGVLVDAVHATIASGGAPTPMEAWIAIWGFMLQLYFDFSGYSDMAIGVGMCFGLSLPANFNSPLRARSGSAFVDRWHMSLVQWVREYVYQPLFSAIARVAPGSSRQRRLIAWAASTILSMGLLAAWHGPQLMLLLGGMAGGVLLVLSQLPSLRRRPTTPVVDDARSRLMPHVHHAFMLVVLSVFGLINRADSFSSLRAILAASIDPSNLSFPHRLQPWLPPAIGSHLAFDGFLPHIPYSGSWSLIIVGTSSAIALAAPNTMQMFGVLPSNISTHLRWRVNQRWAVAIGLLIVAITAFQAEDIERFLYAQF